MENITKVNDSAKNDSKHVLTTMGSHFRKTSHAIALAAMQKLSYKKFDNCIAHHKDKNEANDNLDNIIGIPYKNGDNFSRNDANMVHQIIDRFDLVKNQNNVVRKVFEIKSDGDPEELIFRISMYKE